MWMGILVFALIMPIIFAEEPYFLSIELKDKENGQPLGDANVELNKSIKKTNVNGVAGFHDLHKGTYELEIKRENFETINKEITIEKGDVLELEMEKNVEESSGGIDINVDSPGNNSVITENPLAVEFQAGSSERANNCRLLLQEEGQAGFTVMDKTSEVRNSNTLKGDIRNGRHKIKIMCETEEGNSYSAPLTIEGEGFDKSAERQTENKENSNNSKDEETAPEFDEFLKKAEEAKKQFSKAKKNKDIISLLNLKDKVENAISQGEALKEERIALEELQLSESDYIEKKNEVEDKLNKLKRTTPYNLKISYSKRLISPVSQEDTKEVIEKYLDQKDKDYTKTEVEEIAKASSERQQEVTIYSELEKAEVEYINEKKSNFSIITKEFSPDVNLSEGHFIEDIPPEFAEDVENLETDFRFEHITGSNIKYDPENETITYYTKKDVKKEQMKNSKTIFVTENIPKTNSLTGFSIISDAVLPQGGYTFIIIMAIFGIFGSVFVVGVNYKGVIIPNKTSKEDNEIEDFVELLKTALNYINNEKDNEAVKLYPHIIKGYKRLGQKSQEELRPMIAHISKISDVQYLHRLINKACRQMAQGQFDIQGDLSKEIEECYSDLSSELASKIQEKYNLYKEMLGLKTQRRNEEVRQVYERNFNGNNSGMVEDNIFG